MDFSLSPEVAYALKDNIEYPGTQAQATAAEGVAASRLDDGFANRKAHEVTVTVAAGAIVVSD